MQSIEENVTSLVYLLFTYAPFDYMLSPIYPLVPLARSLAAAYSTGGRYGSDDKSSLYKLDLQDIYSVTISIFIPLGSRRVCTVFYFTEAQLVFA